MKEEVIHELRDGDSATVEVARAVAAAEDTPLEDLPPLYETIEADALDALIERGEDIMVRFVYEGFDVLVTPTEVRLGAR
ncbi:HalOD1 output domain-containing protein [Natrinema sp. 1APR25-10V2]|uniref:HalOD1 output domain-containing protein n=1 Tax=Natrinema sp. 1APR25-10V2 TaxID=2951081 RepID=UPI002874DD3D|nr:HalOD1 output domain-containing protein [Natrinema sp. 1APR25-10V2]MDS0475656.1 hypothetical protein [Natrinema sp. 1APR25-10V2]